MLTAARFSANDVPEVGAEGVDAEKRCNAETLGRFEAGSGGEACAAGLLDSNPGIEIPERPSLPSAPAAVLVSPPRSRTSSSVMTGGPPIVSLRGGSLGGSFGGALASPDSIDLVSDGRELMIGGGGWLHCSAAGERGPMEAAAISSP